MEEKCPICQSDFKTVQAGVSRSTGRPYEAFTACSKFGCKGKPPCKTPLDKPRFVSKTEQISQLQENKARLIGQAQDKKEESIARFNSLNAAISLVCQHQSYNDIKDEKELLMVIFELQKQFYGHNTNHSSKSLSDKYQAKHVWIRRYKKRPKGCEHFGIENKRFHWANVSGKYLWR